MVMKILTQRNAEELRAELFHMILFAMAWVMIGEYSLNFKDYAAASIVVLAIVICLALYSIKLYDLEDSLPVDRDFAHSEVSDKRKKKKGWLFALIFIFEGVAILISWMILLKLQREHWLIPCFALIAGLHFLPLARVIRHYSYYILGLWISGVAVVGYLLLYHKVISIDAANTFIAYSCAAGAVADGLAVVARTQKLK
jgi:hypothetical protein